MTAHDFAAVRSAPEPAAATGTPAGIQSPEVLLPLATSGDANHEPTGGGAHTDEPPPVAQTVAGPVFGKAHGPATTPAGPSSAGGRGPAGTPRTWTVALPAGLPVLNSNHRLHYRKQAEITKTLRDAAFVVARGKVPALARAHIYAFYHPPRLGKFDAGNFYPSAKAAVDGLVDAGVLPDDDNDHLTGPDMRPGDKHPGGRLVLHIQELPT